jgi:hypothetical protein
MVVRLVQQLRHTTLPMRVAAYRSLSAWCCEQAAVRRAVVMHGGLQLMVAALAAATAPGAATHAALRTSAVLHSIGLVVFSY